MSIFESEKIMSIIDKGNLEVFGVLQGRTGNSSPEILRLFIKRDICNSVHYDERILLEGFTLCSEWGESLFCSSSANPYRFVDFWLRPGDAGCSVLQQARGIVKSAKAAVKAVRALPVYKEKMLF